jgi:transcriptional regulator with XRE-family HTH domain
MSKRLAASRIRQHRVRLGLSPEQYGIRIGCSGMTVRRVEAGYAPFLSTQKKFADALDLEVTDLFGDTGAPRRKPTPKPASAQMAFEAASA